MSVILLLAMFGFGFGMFGVSEVFGWPDGAPCLHTVYSSMNPLEAVEHQGGLQLSEPPFFLNVDGHCYNPGQPLSVTLHGTVEFKGFAMQPLVWDGNQASARRTGQFVRMDDNGSWQFQCFRIRDSVTHSHDDLKGRITMWWRGDQSGNTVQFVATVVQNLKRFWVKSVVSEPIPPCSLRQTIGAWSKTAPTAPPPTDNFKTETFQMFNPGAEGSQLISELSVVPVQVPGRQFPAQRLNVGTLAPVFFRTPGGGDFVTPSVTSFAAATTTAPSTFFRSQQQQQQSFRSFGQTAGCRDLAATVSCLQWKESCRNSPWMAVNCKATCRLC